MLGKISLGNLGIVIGGSLTIVGFYAYATGNSTLNLAGFFYGIPLLLGGLALKTSELKPIPFSQPTSPEVLALREKQATVTQNKLRKDVTRYRYGQDVHLDESLQKVGLAPTEEERPVLTTISETETDGAYTLILGFHSPLLSLEAWQNRQEKLEKYFGPDIKIDLAQPEEERIHLAIIKVNEEKKDS
ncbi:MAG: DUF2854 domain-containing protein [Prochloraceae cyanobacterium]|nr:DUF2854 domain-containing protein [Prochloraceae cyanobacterium]